MTDSVAVFPPGYRLTDSSTGAPLEGAVVSFFDAGTTTPKTVYSDAALSVVLGTSVTTDALGYPTSDGTTKTMIYVGTAAYKVRVSTAGGTTIAEHDNIAGAVTTFEPGNVAVTATRPVSTKSLAYTVLTTDQSAVFAGNCSSADVTFTLPSAVTVGAGWFVTVQHAGSANQVIISTSSSQSISSGVTNYGAVLTLSLSGEEVTLISDGGNWRAISHTGPHIKRAQGILTIADRLTAPPGSEVQGALYLISGAPSGAWASFAAGDIVQFSNTGTWVRFTPPSDSGWLAYVQDEDEVYAYIGSSWVQLLTRPASQSDMEAGTSALKTVTPSVVKHHPGVAKFWACVTISGTTPTLAASYNVTSVSRVSSGVYTITIDADFSSANYAVMAMSEANSGNNNRTSSVQFGTRTAGSVQLRFEDSSFNSNDPPSFYVVGFGDQ